MTRLPAAERCGAAVLAACLACIVPGCAADPAPEVEHFAPPGPDLGLPFSEAARVGRTLFVSGQVGNLPGTREVVPGGIGPETRQTLENLRSILERHGSRMDRVVKCTVFLADIGEWPAMNEVYRTFFPRLPPARSAVAGSGLALGARVEIECIAVIDGR